MEHYDEVTEIKRRLVKTTCDICGKDIEWENTESYMDKSVCIEYRHGMAWPGEPDYDTFEPDICSYCFREKIYPLIASLLSPESKAWHDSWGEKYHDRFDNLF